MGNLKQNPKAMVERKTVVLDRNNDLLVDDLPYSDARLMRKRALADADKAFDKYSSEIK